MREYLTKQDDVLDHIISVQYEGRGIDALPAVLAVNPHIRNEPVHLRAGITIKLPELETTPVSEIERFW